MNYKIIVPWASNYGIKVMQGRCYTNDIIIDTDFYNNFVFFVKRKFFRTLDSKNKKSFSFGHSPATAYISACLMNTYIYLDKSDSVEDRINCVVLSYSKEIIV